MKKVHAGAVNGLLSKFCVPLLQIPGVLAVGPALDDAGYYIEIHTSGSAQIAVPRELDAVRVIIKRS